LAFIGFAWLLPARRPRKAKVERAKAKLDLGFAGAGHRQAPRRAVDSSRQIRAFTGISGHFAQVRTGISGLFGRVPSGHVRAFPARRRAYRRTAALFSPREAGASPSKRQQT